MSIFVHGTPLQISTFSVKFRMSKLRPCHLELFSARVIMTSILINPGSAISRFSHNSAASTDPSLRLRKTNLHEVIESNHLHHYNGWFVPSNRRTLATPISFIVAILGLVHHHEPPRTCTRTCWYTAMVRLHFCGRLDGTSSTPPTSSPSSVLFPSLPSSAESSVPATQNMLNRHGEGIEPTATISKNSKRVQAIDNRS